ncbi:hypothetical protein [Streptomyces sp. A5-4]|uniref:hypothetical protein n=1 Tax=Streptomyces sp. A5-4 TaxID=3384771 RepID=UPI003DA92BA9
MFSSTFSTTDWWIAAVVSGLAFGVVMQTWATKKRHKLYLATAPALGGFAATFFGTKAQGSGGEAPLMLYTITMLALLVTMAIFTRFIRRHLARVRSGQPVQRLAPKQVWIFGLTFFAVMLSLAAVL